MTKSQVMLKAQAAAKALDRMENSMANNSTEKCGYYSGMQKMLEAIGGDDLYSMGVHAVSLFGLPYITAEGKVVK